jgi:adenine-specific DNA-methyltransferase
VDVPAGNLLIEGDNLPAMLGLARLGTQADLVLTDPPYNTGSDLRYDDRRSDADWLAYLRPRVKLMHRLLKPSGVLAICIDERELFRLGTTLDELFEQQNRLAIINWQKAAGPRNDQRHVSSTTEYVLVYAKDAEQATTTRLPRPDESYGRYKNVDNDPKGLWREHDLTARTPTEKDQYGIQSPFTGLIHYPAGTRSWTHPKRHIKAWLEEWGVSYTEARIGDGRGPALMVQGGAARNAAEQDAGHRRRTIEGTVPDEASEAARKRLRAGAWPFIWFGLDGRGGPRPKKYLESVRKGMVPTTYWARDPDEDPLALGSTSWDWEQSGLSQSGVKELTALVGPGHGFETVKPLQLFTKLVSLWAPRDGLVLDPFAGSGTTGHAVQYLNAHADAGRRFILIERGRPENGDRYARTLTANRLRRAFSGDWASGGHEPLGGEFTCQELRRRGPAGPAAPGCSGPAE